MGILECENVFQLVVPDGWTVTGTPGRSYDLAAPAGQDLAVTISVYDRAAPAFRDKSAADLVLQFAASAGAEFPDSLQVVAPSEKGQERAFVKFAAGERQVLGAVLLFDQSAILASTNTAGTQRDFEVGEQLMASIAPHSKKRGLFRR